MNHIITYTTEPDPTIPDPVRYWRDWLRHLDTQTEPVTSQTKLTDFEESYD